MTATSVMNPAAVLQRSWTGALRMAVVAFVFVLVALGAFAFGRVSASTSHLSPAIAPSSTPVQSAPAPEACRSGRPC